MKTLARFLVAALLMNSTGCISVTTPRFLMPAPERRWQPTLERAQQLAAAGQPSQADSVLAAYASSYPGTPGAREANYWRSLFQFQGAPVSSMTPAIMLTKYLAEGNVDHRTEAAALLLATVRVDSLARAANVLTNKVQISNGEVATATARAADAKADAKAATADVTDKDAEIRKLRSDLAAAKEELERIKKRLAEPPKKPPRD
jgi:hypothetical protein